MKERPILFSGPMVRAILDGRKTQTRRVVKPQPPEDWTPHTYGMLQPLVGGEPIEPGPRDRWGVCDEFGEWGTFCPYGQPGDRLWVRETWTRASRNGWTQYTGMSDEKRWPETMSRPHTQSRTNSEHHNIIYRVDGEYVASDGTHELWQSPICMPRWASRITLEVVSVRAERVQAISEDDAEAEGCICPRCHDCGWINSGPDGGYQCDHLLCGEPLGFFRDLWDSINAARGYGWETNPMVWVVEFKPIGGAA